MNTSKFAASGVAVILLLGMQPASAQDETAGESASRDFDRSSSIVQNDDGSVTYQQDRTFTDKNGETATRTKTVDAARSEDGGVIIDRQSNAAGSEGRSFSSEQQTALDRDGDGSGSFSRTADASVTDVNGETRTAESDRQSAWQQNNDGGRNFDASRNASTSEGRSFGGDFTARTTRDGNGGGSFESVRDRTTNQGGLRVERQGVRQLDDNGAVSRDRSGVRTRK